jgi:hypothetical protein
MSGYPPTGGGTARRIEKAIELIEIELQHAIAYVNDAVIPEIRKESITAMRRVAESLRKLADRMEQPRQGPPNDSGGPQP